MLTKVPVAMRYPLAKQDHLLAARHGTPICNDLDDSFVNDGCRPLLLLGIVD